MYEDSEFDEYSVIKRFQHGDKQAYGRLVIKYQQRAYFSALGLVRNHEGALDLSQEAFVRAYRSIKKFDGNRKFFTWYYQILRNLCFNFLRDSARHARPFSDIGENQINEIVDNSPNASSQVEQTEMKEAVWNAINSLKANQKEIIILKDFHDMSYKEIAETLNCPVGTVMSRLFNARQALKEKLELYFNA